jgi:Protein of unknown function (DUF1559)
MEDLSATPTVVPKKSTAVRLFATLTSGLALTAAFTTVEPFYLAALVMFAVTAALSARRWRIHRRLGWSLPVAVVVLGLSAWWFLAIERIRHSAQSSTCRLAQLALAFHSYAGTHDRLPGPAILSPQGQPLLSWRVAILPFIEQDQLYRRFRLDESWDSPHNLTLLPLMPFTFRPYPDVQAEPNTTLFQAFVGPGTALERAGLRLPQDFLDGTSNTILLVEASVGVLWTKPEDIVYDPHGPLPPLGKVYRNDRVLFPVEQPTSFRAAMADGSSRSIPKTISEATLRAAITRNGGDKLGRDWNQ